MDLLRDIQRRVAGGTAAALLVPVAIVIVGVALGTGGFGGLNALGQAFNGPDIPGVEPASARADDADEDDVPGELLAGVDPAATARPAAARRTDSTRRRAQARRRRADRRNRPGAGPTTGTGAQPQPPGQPQPTPAPTEPPSTVRQVGNQVKEITDPVPVAGEPAGQVVDVIVDTADQLPLP
jgi:hypothetical protein